MELLYLFVGLVLGLFSGLCLHSAGTHLAFRQQLKKQLRETLGGLGAGESAHIIVVLGKGRGGGKGVEGLVDDGFLEAWRQN